jgi:hypothetical protein
MQSTRVTAQLVSVACVAVLAVLAACATERGEPHASVLQPVEGVDDAGQDAGFEGGGSCAHSPCSVGVALTAGCGSCVGTVCAADRYCCTTAWDATCVSEVASLCGAAACAAGIQDAGDAEAAPSSCAHPVCAAGVALVSSCAPCAAALCAVDAYCCAVAWDATCVSEVGGACGTVCQ